MTEKLLKVTSKLNYTHTQPLGKDSILFKAFSNKNYSDQIYICRSVLQLVHTHTRMDNVVYVDAAANWQG